jgi:hypothetical protein
VAPTSLVGIVPSRDRLLGTSDPARREATDGGVTPAFLVKDALTPKDQMEQLDVVVDGGQSCFFAGEDRRCHVGRPATVLTSPSDGAATREGPTTHAAPTGRARPSRYPVQSLPVGSQVTHHRACAAGFGRCVPS